MTNPHLLILDEPATGLDPASKLYISNLIWKFKENWMIILTTHYLEDVDQIGDWFGIIRDK